MAHHLCHTCRAIIFSQPDGRGWERVAFQNQWSPGFTKYIWMAEIVFLYTTIHIFSTAVYACWRGWPCHKGWNCQDFSFFLCHSSHFQVVTLRLVYCRLEGWENRCWENGFKLKNFPAWNMAGLWGEVRIPRFANSVSRILLCFHILFDFCTWRSVDENDKDDDDDDQLF